MERLSWTARSLFSLRESQTRVLMAKISQRRTLRGSALPGVVVAADVAAVVVVALGEPYVSHFLVFDLINTPSG